MTERMTVSELDLHRLLGIATGHLGDLPAEGLPPSLLSDLTGLIRCDEASFFRLNSTARTGTTLQIVPAEDAGDPGDPEGPETDPFWIHYWDSRPCSYPDRSGDLRSVTKISDFYSSRQWHSTGMYRDCFHGQIEHEIMVCLPAGPGRSLRAIFFRGAGADFSERDRGLLALLRPHLHEAYRAAERRRDGTPELTRRQRELL